MFTHPRRAPELLRLRERLYRGEVPAVHALLEASHLEHDLHGRALVLVVSGRKQRLLQLHQDPRGRDPLVLGGVVTSVTKAGEGLDKRKFRSVGRDPVPHRRILTRNTAAATLKTKSASAAALESARSS